MQLYSIVQHDKKRKTCYNSHLPSVTLSVAAEQNLIQTFIRLLSNLPSKETHLVYVRIYVCVFTLLLSGVNLYVYVCVCWGGWWHDWSHFIRFQQQLSQKYTPTWINTLMAEHWRTSWMLSQLKPHFHCRNSPQEPANLCKNSLSSFNLGVLFSQPQVMSLIWASCLKMQRRRCARLVWPNSRCKTIKKKDQKNFSSRFYLLDLFNLPRTRGHSGNTDNGGGRNCVFPGRNTHSESGSAFRNAWMTSGSSDLTIYK